MSERERKAGVCGRWWLLLSGAIGVMSLNIPSTLAQSPTTHAQSPTPEQVAIWSASGACLPRDQYSLEFLHNSSNADKESYENADRGIEAYKGKRAGLDRLAERRFEYGWRFHVYKAEEQFLIGNVHIAEDTLLEYKPHVRAKPDFVATTAFGDEYLLRIWSIAFNNMKIYWKMFEVTGRLDLLEGGLLRLLEFDKRWMAYLCHGYSGTVPDEPSFARLMWRSLQLHSLYLARLHSGIHAQDVQDLSRAKAFLSLLKQSVATFDAERREVEAQWDERELARGPLTCAGCEPSPAIQKRFIEAWSGRNQLSLALGKMAIWQAGGESMVLEEARTHLKSAIATLSTGNCGVWDVTRDRLAFLTSGHDPWALTRARFALGRALLSLAARTDDADATFELAQQALEQLQEGLACGLFHTGPVYWHWGNLHLADAYAWMSENARFAPEVAGTEDPRELYRTYERIHRRHALASPEQEGLRTGIPEILEKAQQEKES